MNSPHIGILAGMGPKSTSPFLNLIIEECQNQYGACNDIDFPPMLVYSLPTPFYMDRAIDHTSLQETILKGLRRLESTDVAFISMPCNTAHIYYQYLSSNINIPLLNMINISMESISKELNRIALIATELTIEAGVYQNTLESNSINYFWNDELQDQINIILQSLKKPAVKSEKNETRRLWNRLTEWLKLQGVDSLLLACTDFNAILKAGDMPFTLIDTSRELARKTVQEWLSVRKRHEEHYA